MNNNDDNIKKSKRSKAKQKSKEERINEVMSQIRDMNKGTIKSDVLGSYTGVSEDDDYPVQDADDL